MIITKHFSLTLAIAGFVAKSPRKKRSATFLDQWKGLQRGEEKIPKERERRAAKFRQRAKSF